MGGPLAWSAEVHTLAVIEHVLRVLAWQQTEDGKKNRNQPEATKPPAFSWERKAAEERVESRASAWRRRQQQQ